MKLVCLSDTHNLHGNIRNVPEGDVLIHAGDFSGTGKIEEIKKFAKWMSKLPHENKIVVCGNHELEVSFKTKKVRKIFEPKGITVLDEDSVIINNIKFWGQPRTPKFYDWGWSYKKGLEAREVWQRLPDDVDVLICHGPPYGIGDSVVKNAGRVFLGPPMGKIIEVHCGCPEQLKRIKQVQPKYVICGHIHDSYGIHDTNFNTKIVNASICTETYSPTNKPIVLEI